MVQPLKIPVVASNRAIRVARPAERVVEASPAISPALLDRQQSADYLNVSPSSIKRLTLTGKLSFVKIGGRILYSIEALNAFIAAQTVTSKPPP